jgi:hypothetical protein
VSVKERPKVFVHNPVLDHLSNEQKGRVLERLCDFISDRSLCPECAGKPERCAECAESLKVADDVHALIRVDGDDARPTVCDGSRAV